MTNPLNTIALSAFLTMSATVAIAGRRQDAA